MDEQAIRDVFSALGDVRIRRMFGGWGVYRGALMFALAARGGLYLKTDGETLGHFKALGCRPFTYRKSDGREVTTGYWSLPAHAMEDPEAALKLADLALAASVRAVARRGRNPGRG